MTNETPDASFRKRVHRETAADGVLRVALRAVGPVHSLPGLDLDLGLGLGLGLRIPIVLI